MFSGVFFQERFDVEVVAALGFSLRVFDGNVFIERVIEDVVGNRVVHHVEQHVFMLRLDDIPRIFLVLPRTGRDDCHQQIVEFILPDVGEIRLALFAQGVDEHHHFDEVEGVVGEGFFGIGDYGVTLLSRRGDRMVEDIVVDVAFRRAIRIVVLLKHISEVEMAILVDFHQCVVLLKLFQQSRIVVGRRVVERLGFDFFEIRFLAFQLVDALGVGDRPKHESQYD